MKKMIYSFALGAGMLLATMTNAHDTWVQTNTNVVRVGDVIHVDLLNGNHGNEHRDFKMAGKATLESATLEAILPDGSTRDLKPSATDQGLGTKEGFWASKLIAEKPGLYMITHTSDKVVDYAPKRSVKSGKTFFLASASLDKLPADLPGYNRVLGHALELVPQKNPVTPMGVGSPISVQLLYKGKPLAGHVVSFVPRGVTLNEGFDPKYERKTNDSGIATFEPPDGNYYLVVAHHEDENAKGKDYDSIKYSATLTVYVPALCGCCGE
jgi:uncharacterized GH25 family protein